VGDAVWHFPHWDVPWYALPARCIVTVHDLGHLNPRVVSRTRGLIARPWIERALHHATWLTTVSEFTRREIVERWPHLGDRIDVVPNAVDPCFFDAQRISSRLHALVDAGPFILSVGNLKRHKNLAVGVDVLASHSHLRWVVVGEWFPDWRAVERKAASLGVGDRIHYLGKLDDSDINALYRAAVCLLFPSRYEGFGLPILEALAAGAPVVASNHAAVRETLGSAGWICDVDRPEQFAAAVREAMRPDAGLKARGVARAREYTWSDGAARLSTRIEHLHARSGGVGRSG
jgi:glycosyltransferase involved in cell wall biosynthesis